MGGTVNGGLAMAKDFDGLSDQQGLRYKVSASWKINDSTLVGLAPREIASGVNRLLDGIGIIGNPIAFGAKGSNVEYAGLALVHGLTSADGPLRREQADRASSDGRRAKPRSPGELRNGVHGNVCLMGDR